MRDYAKILKSARICLNVDRDSNCLSECFGCNYINHDDHIMDMVRDAADAIEELQAELVAIRNQLPHWISVRDASDGEICAAKMVLSAVENLNTPMLMFEIEKSAVRKALLLMLRICEAEPPKGVSE